MIFKSHQVNLDPEPMISDMGVRFAQGAEVPGLHGRYDPRPEYEPTRDTLPWVWRNFLDPGVSYGRAGGPYTRLPGDPVGWYSTFEPRREEYDTPVNPILVELRSYWAHIPRISRREVSIFLDASPELDEWPDATPAEIDHARRVLSRLASLETKQGEER